MIIYHFFKGTGVIGLEENEPATDDDQGQGAKF